MAGVKKRPKLLFVTLRGAMTPAMRQKSWSDVMWEVNVVDGFGRLMTEVKKKWMCMKSETKGKLAAVR